MGITSVAAVQLYLRGRMALPQRHRLLHAYPLAAATPRRPENHPGEVVHDLGVSRGLLVGVLPHPFCNPAVTGCGFCIFPHEAYQADRAAEVVEHVIREINGRLERQPGLARRRVAGLFFGGGTANLTPADPFRHLCRALADGFDLSDAEVTLEGVPAYFVKRKPRLLDILREEIPARHVRISMGLQTFDEGRLRQMGRHAFATADTFAEVVKTAHARGCTVSADFLFNLPWQTRDEMHRDVEQALRLGLDHLGLCHPVMFRRLGTAWSRDPALLAGLPTNEQAAENWLALRRQLLQGGFVQTSLTNFERARHAGGVRRFVYEEFGFRPDHYDMAGFGPGAISFAAGPRFTDGLKTINPDAAAAYVAAIRSGRSPADRLFEYDPTDLRIFYLTRRLAALEMDRFAYARLFDADPLADFAGEFDALRDRGLVEITDDAIRPTPLGMFYADSIAALFAWRRTEARRNGRSLPVIDPREGPRPMNDNGRGHM